MNMLTTSGMKRSEKSKRGCYINRIPEHPFNGYLVFKTTTNNNKYDLTHFYCVHNTIINLFFFVISIFCLFFGKDLYINCYGTVQIFNEKLCQNWLEVCFCHWCLECKILVLTKK